MLSPAYSMRRSARLRVANQTTPTTHQKKFAMKQWQSPDEVAEDDGLGEETREILYASSVIRRGITSPIVLIGWLGRMQRRRKDRRSTLLQFLMKTKISTKME